MIETGFGKEFSEPPSVAVSTDRTHCSACKEPLDPAVMHQCHGNQQHQAPVVSFTDITEACPECLGDGVLVDARSAGVLVYVVVCKDCRTYLWPLVSTREEAIASWNLQALSRKKGCWPVWLVDMPGLPPVISTPVIEAKASHPDLSNYKGVCPTCRGLKGTLKDAETGEIDPCTHCDGKGVLG